MYITTNNNKQLSFKVEPDRVESVLSYLFKLNSSNWYIKTNDLNNMLFLFELYHLVDTQCLFLGLIYWPYKTGVNIPELPYITDNINNDCLDNEYVTTLIKAPSFDRLSQYNVSLLNFVYTNYCMYKDVFIDHIKTFGPPFTTNTAIDEVHNSAITLDGLISRFSLNKEEVLDNVLIHNEGVILSSFTTAEEMKEQFDKLNECL